ncbi:MAG: methyltransferase domain-containing protein [Bacteroidetes bacterium]|nr:methyltransferase domain-containing protein [Bacteroidota bacterium]
MSQFSVRSTLPEIMDQPGVSVADTRQALRELEVVNKRLGGYSTILNALNHIHLPQRQITIMDAGCGGGDILRAIAKWANKKGKTAKLIGVDWNPVMTNFATEQSQEFPNIEYITLSVFDDALMSLKADITTCSLFCHHFEEEQLVKLIKRMYALAGIAVIINDLHRNWFAYYAIKVLTRLFSKTYMVKYDAPLSVARAFTRKDLQHILSLAGISNYTLRWKWAWRWELIIHKPVTQ